MALIISGGDMNKIAVRLNRAGALTAQARIDKLREWLVDECEGLQSAAYNQLEQQMKKPARKRAR